MLAFQFPNGIDEVIVLSHSYSHKICDCVCIIVQVKASEGRALAEGEHRKQIEKAEIKNTNSYLQSVPSKKLYFETSAKTGEGVGELFDFVQTTLLEEMDRRTTSSSGREGRKRGSQRKGLPGMERSIRVGDDSRQGPDKSCCN